MKPFTERSWVIIGFFVLVVTIYLIRLFNLQVLDSSYKDFAMSNALREVTQYPARGLIYDRNKKLLVSNKPAYDLIISPRLTQDFDTLLFCKLLDIDKSELIEKIQKAKDYSRYRPSILIKQLTPETNALLQEQLYKFKGFHTQSRTLRYYQYPAAAHLLGYVGEVNQKEITNSDYYTPGDYIGKSGIEKSYENQLRGEKGIKKLLVDVHNRVQGSYKDGEEDKPTSLGKNIISTIDIDLQVYAEKLLQNKRGGVVAIEPATGEILSLVSSPGYDPNLLVGRARGNNYAKLLRDEQKPLFNRSLLSAYPPGSTFKTVNLLIGLQEKAITTRTHFSCSGRDSRPIRCTHFHSSSVDFIEAIKESCNPYLWQAFRATLNKYPKSSQGYEVWYDYVKKFGFGRKLNSDLIGESKGMLPTKAFYDKLYRGSWNALTVRSLSIGQGELGATPLQLANTAMVLANRGYYYIPHIAKEIEDDTISSRFKKKIEVDIDSKYFDPVVEGMHRAVQPGTSAGLSYIPGVEMCGKTGSAQNPHGEAHSIFIAFAPKDNPKIAISVYVENGIWGAKYAAPIASLLVEKYLNDSIADRRKWIEKNMINADLIGHKTIKVREDAETE